MSIVERHRPTGAPKAPTAVAWISDRRALIARVNEEGQLTTCKIERGREPEASYVTLVARAIGDQDRVEVLGPLDLRLALERAYVGVYQQPERLVDVEYPVDVDEAELIDRLYEVSTVSSAAGR